MKKKYIYELPKINNKSHNCEVGVGKFYSVERFDEQTAEILS